MGDVGSVYLFLLNLIFSSLSMLIYFFTIFNKHVYV